MKRISSFALVLALIFAVLPAPALAAETSVPQLAKSVGSKYGINIRYPVDQEGEPLITERSLETLDLALENLTPAAVKQVSRYYQEKNGKKIEVSYVRTHDLNQGEITLAGFDDGKSLIELYIPAATGTVMVSGQNPISIVHEFAHAIHLMYTDSYGFGRMEGEWSAFNGGETYHSANIRQNPGERTFINGYAATSFAEDVAETMAHVLVRNQPGQGFRTRLTSSAGQTTGLGKKVAYLERMLARCFGESSDLQQNYAKIYATSGAVSYQKMKFSGEYLQYMNYPQPPYILGGILNSLGFQKDQAVWIRALGGWFVKTTDRRQIIVFPGGVWCDVNSSFVSPI